MPRELKELLKGLAANTALGRSLSRRAVDISADAILTMIDTFPGKRIWVEEQDHSFYILHLDHEVLEDLEPDGEKWVLVGPESLLFRLLTRRRGVLISTSRLAQNWTWLKRFVRRN